MTGEGQSRQGLRHGQRRGVQGSRCGQGCAGNEAEQPAVAEGAAVPGWDLCPHLHRPRPPPSGTTPQDSGGAVPGRARRRVPVCETRGPRGAGGERGRQEHGRVSRGPGGPRLPLLSGLGRGAGGGARAPAWETGLQRTVWSAPLGLSVAICQMGNSLHPEQRP